MESSQFLREVVRQNKFACFLVGIFLVVEVVLLAPPYDSQVPNALGFAIMLVTAVTCLNRYFWIRMFRPILQRAGAQPVTRGSGECCCCCLCRKEDGSKARVLRAFFLLVYVTIYAITISALVLEQQLTNSNGKDPHPWVYFSFQWSGGFVLMLVSAWFVDLLIMTFRALLACRRRSQYGRWRGKEKLHMPLWLFPFMWLVTFVTLVSVASVEGTKDPTVRTVQVPLAKLPECLDGYKIAMISDVHAGPTVGRAEIARHANAVNGLGADAIVMVGDLVDDQVEDIKTIVEPIAHFRAPDGQFFAMGNHEEYTGEAEKWAEFVSERGFQVLNDSRVTLPPNVAENGSDCFFFLAGVNDFESDPDYEAALDGLDDAPVVLLAHQPTQVSKASEYSVGLQLSGHTHGGQVFPYHVLAYLDQGYVSGLHKKGETFLYVSEGAVGWGPRMRLLSTTEYTLVVLRSPELFSDPDTSSTEATRAAGAAGVLLLLTFIYCLGYPVVRAFRRAKGNDDDDVESGRESGSGTVGVDNLKGAAEAPSRRRVVADDHAR